MIEHPGAPDTLMFNRMQTGATSLGDCLLETGAVGILALGPLWALGPA
ncbi:MAG: hypothetical protein JWR00_2162 [Rubritepida sp.]|nr:hypothetical protein [Rubritepida sp.]